MKVLILSMAVAVCLAPAALAGTVIKQQELTPGNATARQTVTIYLDADKLRVEGNNPSSGQYVVIFDKAKQVMWFAEPSKGTYLELTAAQVQAMGAQMQGAMSQMQEAMKQMEAEMANLPPQQRAMMEQMMKGR
ncbi:MAG TPA: hypothetical protein VNN17_03170, partial [Terriglobia bacterium]|nr:hypothetical protein [Terriglobia bacterium]